MSSLRLKAHIIDLTDDLLLVLAPHNGEWIISHCAFKNVLHMLDGSHNPEEIIKNNPELSESSINSIIESLRRADMFFSEEEAGDGCNNSLVCNGTPCVMVMNMTDQCNLNCLYCYADASPLNTRYMSKETAVRAASEMISLNADNDQQLAFVFHGGEPTLNLDAIEAVCEFLAPYRERAVCQIQTNAVNVTERFVSLVKQYDIQVGVSIDGYKEIHDKTRQDAAGHGSFERVREGISRLRAEGISVGPLTVLSRKNYRHISELLDFYVREGFDGAAILRLREFGRESLHPDLALSGDELFESYRDILDWLTAHNTAHEQPFGERTISQMVKIIATGRRDYMCMRKPCGAGRNTIGVDPEGGVYPCDELVGQPEFYMGNLTEQSLKDIIIDSSSVKLLDKIVKEKTLDCSKCVWESICPGICSSQCALSSHGSSTEEAECVFMRKMIPELLRRYWDNPAIFGLLCEDVREREPKHFYFNLLYGCNSHCIFCAADRDLRPRSLMITLAMMRDMIDSQGMETGDVVILNGGELTLHPEIIEIVRLLSSHGLYSVLSTNGRRLADREFAKSVLEAGACSFTIPFFGHEAKWHDYCTGAPGSFAETVAGIHNLIQIRKELGLDVRIELKILYIKCLLEENPRIMEWICQTFPEVDSISLNALLVSDTVLTRADELIPDFSSWSESLNQTITVAKRYGVTDKINLSDTPYCLLDTAHYDFLESLLDQEGLGSLDDKVYLDGYNTDGQELFAYSTEVKESCGDCAMYRHCAFINKLYGDPEVAKASLRMLS